MLLKTENLKEIIHFEKLSSFKVAKFEVTIKALEAMVLPEFKGSMFRGGFGSTLKRICCIDKQVACDQCVVKQRCAYAYIFESSPPEEATFFSGNQQIPRPYIFEPPLDKCREFAVGEKLVFGLILIGKAVDYLPYFIVALKELGHHGITKKRYKYELVTVEAVDELQNKRAVVYSGQNQTVFNRVLPLAWQDFYQAASKMSVDRVKIKLLTPLRLKSNGKYISSDLPLEILVQNLTVRANALNVFHCGGTWSEELKELRALAARVNIAAKKLVWKETLRRSNRQQKLQSLSGIVGTVTYEGNLKALLPLLILGQFIHVGSDSVFGCGKYIIN